MIRSLACLSLVAFLSACSSIPAGGDAARHPAVLALAASPEPSSCDLAVAAITSCQLAAEAKEQGWSPAGLEPAALRRDLVRALRASRRFRRVRPAGGSTELWRGGDDLVAEVELNEVRARFDGHNALWLPNLVNFACNVFPAWWVATEEYSLELELCVTLYSAETGRLVGQRAVPVRVTGTFDEFDRGWQLFGPIWPTLGPAEWRNVSSRLLPALRREALARAAVTLVQLRRAALLQGQLERAHRKTLLLAVGLSEHADTTLCPDLRGAAHDARQVSQALVELAAVQPQHMRRLLNERATRSAILAGIQAHLGRSRPGDLAILYFAGYGTTVAGELALVPFEGPGSALRWSDLRRALLALPARAVVIVDAGFGAGGRALPCAAPSLPVTEGLVALFATCGAQPALAPPHLGGGLFTHHLLRELRAADEAARLNLRSVSSRVREAVAVDAELLGAHQEPVVLTTKVSLPLRRPSP